MHISLYTKVIKPIQNIPFEYSSADVVKYKLIQNAHFSSIRVGFRTNSLNNRKTSQDTVISLLPTIVINLLNTGGGYSFDATQPITPWQTTYTIKTNCYWKSISKNFLVRSNILTLFCCSIVAKFIFCIKYPLFQLTIILLLFFSLANFVSHLHSRKETEIKLFIHKWIKSSNDHVVLLNCTCCWNKRPFNGTEHIRTQQTQTDLNLISIYDGEKTDTTDGEKQIAIVRYTNVIYTFYPTLRHFLIYLLCYFFAESNFWE